MGKSKYKYDIAVSFAGEDRAVVQKMANLLAANSIAVFYDSWEQAQLWGKDLYQYLDMIYRQAAEYCVIFVSENYIKKAWTKHELKSAQARAFQQNEAYILPIKLDDTELPGLPETICYLDLRTASIEQVAELLVEKLNIASRPNIPAIIANAKSADQNIRIDALSKIAIYQLHEQIEMSINLMLNDPIPAVRERAAWAIDNLRDARALEALIAAIHDDIFGVRSAAGWGLVHLGEIVIPYMKEISSSSNNPGARAMANLVLENL
jgi:hypothetical protein